MTRSHSLSGDTWAYQPTCCAGAESRARSHNGGGGQNVGALENLHQAWLELVLLLPVPQPPVAPEPPPAPELKDKGPMGSLHPISHLSKEAPSTAGLGCHHAMIPTKNTGCRPGGARPREHGK